MADKSEITPAGEPAADEQSDEHVKAFFLALACRGKDAWNAWRRVPANKNVHVTFAGIDFSEAPRDEIDFSGFEFGHHANFSGCKWRGARTATDPKTFAFGRPCFNHATFGVGASFNSTIFGGAAFFENATFGTIANFACAAFEGGASFTGADFNAGARFTLDRYAGRAMEIKSAFAPAARRPRVRGRTHTRAMPSRGRIYRPAALRFSCV
jgi:hypothetical protein